jgi:hypothetical protein
VSDWVYDWLADMALPGLAGIGGIVVGTGAMVAAFASYNLARQVRGDERRREEEAARERYRDQLIRVLEPAVSALLEHRAEMVKSRTVGTPAERNLRSDAMARLKLAQVVASGEERRVVLEAMTAYIASHKTKHWQVMGGTNGELTIYLANILGTYDADDEVKKIGELVAKQTKRWGTPPSAGPTGSA